MWLKNQWVNEEIKKKIKKYLETNGNEDTSTQNLWDASKAVLRGEFIAIQAFLKKEEKSQINNFTQHLNELGKEQRKPKVTRRKEILIFALNSGCWLFSNVWWHLEGQMGVQGSFVCLFSCFSP